MKPDELRKEREKLLETLRRNAELRKRREKSKEERRKWLLSLRVTADYFRGGTGSEELDSKVGNSYKTFPEERSDGDG